VKRFRIFLFTFLIILSVRSNAGDTYVAEGEFWAAENDSKSFINQQLKTTALKNAVNSFLSKMELNSSVFWQLIERKVDTELKERREFSEKKISEARESGAFDEVLKLESEWRTYRLNYVSNLLESKRLYIGFSSSPITSSMVNPQLKLSTFKVTLNRNMVQKFYFEVTKSDSNRQFQNLLITFNLQLPNDSSMGPMEFNESISLIQKAVNEKWLTWLESEYKEVFNNFIIASESQERQLNKYIFSPPGTVNLVDMSMVVKNQEEIIPNLESDISDDNNKTSESMVMSVDGAPEKSNESNNLGGPINAQSSENEMTTFRDSQWLKINLRISDLEYDKDFKKIKFSLSGGHLFFDLNSREVIIAADYPNTDRIYSISDISSFSSSVGTHIFNLPLNSFRQGKKVFTKAPQINNQAVLTIKNLKKPEDIIGLSDFLNLGGESINLKVRSFDIVANGAKITLNYFGEPALLKKKLAEWENKKVISLGRWHFYSEENELKAELLPDVNSEQSNTEFEAQEERL